MFTMQQLCSTNGIKWGSLRGQRSEWDGRAQTGNFNDRKSAGCSHPSPPPLCLYSFFCLSWLLTMSLEDYATVVYHVFFSSAILVSLHVHTNSQGTPSIKTELLELTATPYKQFIFGSCSPAEPALRLVQPAGLQHTHMCRSSVAQPDSPPALS